MKKTFILLIFCFLGASGIYSQSSSYTLKTDIWFDNERLINPSQNSAVNKKNSQEIASSEDSTVLLNFHPVKTFNEEVTPFTSSYDISKSSRLTVIVVFHSPDTITEHGIWSVMRDEKQITALTDKRLLRQKSEYQYPVKKAGIPMINTSMQAFPKIRGKADSSHFVLGKAILPDSTLSTFSGDIAECLVFSRFLKKPEALKIETYLAIKYGINLIESDYLSPSDIILWDYEKNKEYSNGIAGIGKDSTFGLDQKQGCSSEEIDLLTISAGNFSALNEDNKFILPEASYLVWGHNNNDLIYNEIACEEAYPLLERKWLMQTTYTDVNNRFPTAVRFQLPEEYRDTNRLCYLVIDRTGTGDFTSGNAEYIIQSRVDEDGFVYFNNLLWDLDGSGKDMFTFSFGAVMELVATNSCPNSPTGNININICGGESPFIYLLTNNATDQQLSYQGERDYVFENLPAGLYTLTVIDFNNITISKQIKIEEYPGLIASFPLEYTIQQYENTFDAQDYLEESARSYIWEKDNIFFSENALVDMSFPGKYKLTVTDSNGCSYISEITAIETVSSGQPKNNSGEETAGLLQQEETEPQYKVYPNPTAGEYSIEIDLPQESPVSIRIFTANGILLDTWKNNGKKHYTFESYISIPGNYIVEIENMIETKKIKLIVGS